MKKYNWTIDTLYNRVDYLKALLDKANNKKEITEIQTDICRLENWILDFNDDTNYDMLGFLEIYQDFKDDFLPLKFLWNDYNYFFESSKSINVPFLELKRNSLSTDDILSLTHDFYKSLNSSFYTNFMKNFDKRKKHIAFQPQDNLEFCGETIVIKTTKEAFLTVGRYYTLEDFTTTVHKYSHATSFQINPNHLDHFKRSFTEIDSMFMELISSDYYKSLTNDNNATMVKTKIHNSYSLSSRDVALIISLIEKELERKEEFKCNKDIRQSLDEKRFLSLELDDILLHSSIDLSIYLTSYLFAIELYNLYKEDKEKALYILKKIILLDNKDEQQYYSNIKELGIIPNLGLHEYQTNLQNEAEQISLSRKKNK